MFFMSKSRITLSGTYLRIRSKLRRKKKLVLKVANKNKFHNKEFLKKKGQ